MSLTGIYDPDNIFAKILRGEMPCVKIYEDDDVFSFMDVFPQSDGHTLVIPKTASRNLLETDPEVLGTLMTQTQRIARAVNKALAPDGIIITQFNGAPAGQTVFHLHFHIIPRYTGEDMRGHAGKKMADLARLETFAARIRTEL